MCVWPFINELLTGQTQLWVAHVSLSLSLSCEAFIITWQLPSPAILTASAHAL